MDSPIFGSQKSHQNQKNQKNIQFTTNTSDFSTSDWYVSNKTNSNTANSQISNDLKLAYTILILEKNLKTFFAKINKSINKKKIDSFQKIQIQALKQCPYIQTNQKQIQQNNFSLISNPEIKPLTMVCISKVNKKLQNVCRILNTLKLKKLAIAWSRLYINVEKNHLIVIQNQYGSCIESDLGICSKIENKKRLNSKKHAKQMKQNSILNHTSSDIQMQNQKLMQQILNEEYHQQNFLDQMNSLLSVHQNRFLVDSDRQTWQSDNGISHSSFENNIKPTQNGKNQLNNKKRS